uniref:Uncharacterized protein ORF126 n=1 Tax=Nothoceros aenigmaticus TaxID=13813 RepID=C3RYQ7_9EMBR|nr:hypothetical protein MeaeMp56 [Nothoceros aenigmaticus]ACC86813.1 hypothetical protein MeaeMp56 [Nothoceros aenigmaticus]
MQDSSTLLLPLVLPIVYCHLPLCHPFVIFCHLAIRLLFAEMNGFYQSWLFITKARARLNVLRLALTPLCFPSRGSPPFFLSFFRLDAEGTTEEALGACHPSDASRVYRLAGRVLGWETERKREAEA